MTAGPRSGRPWALARRVRNRLFPGAAVLLYHRISRVPEDPFALSVPPEVFDEHLQLIKKYLQPCTLTSLVEGLRAGRVPQRSAVVTFDDGYADNLHVALPLLEKHGVPATVFVTTGGAEQGGFWWDRLTDIVFSVQGFDGELPLSLPNGKSQVTLGRTPDERRQAFFLLYDCLRTMNWAERDGVISDLALQLTNSVGDSGRGSILAVTAEVAQHPAVSGSAPRLNSDELRELANSSLIQIGAHTVNHPVLASLPLAEQWAEIDESRRHLENELGKRIRSFAYPFGDRGSFDEKTVRLVADAGFDCAATTIDGRVRRGTSSFELPRIQVFAWDAARLERTLETLAVAV